MKTKRMTEGPSKASGWLGWLVLAFAACLLLGVFSVGIGLFIWGASQVIDGRSSLNWPASEGKVVAVKLIDNEGDLSAKIEYAYVVDDRWFEGHRLTCVRTTTDPDSARNAYPEGKTVVVRYHPKHPDRSVLIPGVCPESFFILGVGISFILGTTTMTVVSVRAISKHNKR